MPARLDLDPGEQIIRRINRSIMDLVPVLFASAMIVLVTLAGLVGFIMYHSQLQALPTSFVMLIAIVLIGVAVLVALTGTYVYNHNYLVVTNMHIIKVEQVGLFNDKTAQLELSHVQDVNGSRHGFLETILDYGDIEIETAAAQENFIFRNCPQPQALSEQLAQLHAKYIQEPAPSSAATSAAQAAPTAAPTPPASSA